MNCANCGAPLAPVEGRDHLMCGHCHAFHFPHELADSADRIKPLGGGSDFDCPHCPTHLEHGAIDGVRVHYCPTCRGLLVASELFAAVVQRRRARFRGADQTPAPLDGADLRRQTNCPRCRRKMETHAYYGPGNVVIDSCAPCRLIWADAGEVAAIEMAPGRRR